MIYQELSSDCALLSIDQRRTEATAVWLFSGNSKSAVSLLDCPGKICATQPAFSLRSHAVESGPNRALGVVHSRSAIGHSGPSPSFMSARPSSISSTRWRTREAKKAQNNLKSKSTLTSAYGDPPYHARPSTTKSGAGNTPARSIMARSFSLLHGEVPINLS